jgi:hypothetical protein
MLRRDLFFLLPIFCVVAITCPSSAEIDPNFVVAVWLCDEGDGDTLADASGNEHDGSFVGDLGWADGKFGAALEFLGNAGSRVEVPHDDSLTLEAWTISAWVKLMPAGDWTVVVVKDPANGTQNYSLDMDGGGRVFAEVTSGGSWSDCGSVTTVFDDEWHFIAASYDGSTLRVYVDGNMENEQDFGAGDVNTAPVAIGGRMDSSQPLTGIVDDIGLFSAALDEDDLMAIMNDGLNEALGFAAVEPSLKSTTMWGQIKQQ